MNHSFSEMILDNLSNIFKQTTDKLSASLPAKHKENSFHFEALGRTCVIEKEGIYLENRKQENSLGLLISLYALNSGRDILKTEPLKGFPEICRNRSYAAGFAENCKSLLSSKVPMIRRNLRLLTEIFNGETTVTSVGGDFAMLVKPFPKIALCYVFYEADNDFPASVTCLFSSNANLFLPDGCLADLGEYTSQRISEIIRDIS